MKTSKKLIYTIVISLVISQAYAQYEIKKYSINNGGGKLTGGSYELNASIGQTDASATMSNGAYSLDSGFWHQNNDLIFKNTFE
ncbi:MAG: hypothetical protein AB8B80_13065 [Marinicellaceae bacterium]